MEFTFKWINSQGNEQGFRSKSGSFDGETLVLDEVAIPVSAIVDADHRDGRVILSAVDTGEQVVHLGFVVKKGSAAQLRRVLGIARSAALAEAYREALARKERLHLFRTTQCPHCGATIVLANLPQTPQVYCRFCDVLSTVEGDGSPPSDEREFTLCDECGMFSKPRKFTIVYFYFLVFFYGWHQRTTWRCPGCMRRDAWKMFFGNLLFVLGVPVALVQLARCYSGSLGGGFAGLDAANLKARQGDIQGAVAGYRPILERVPVSAGVKYNLGRALVQLGELGQAAEAFRMALDDCANYSPASHCLADCYEQLGEHDELAAHRRRYDPLSEAETQ